LYITERDENETLIQLVFNLPVWDYESPVYFI